MTVLYWIAIVVLGLCAWYIAAFLLSITLRMWTMAVMDGIMKMRRFWEEKDVEQLREIMGKGH